MSAPEAAEPGIQNPYRGVSLTEALSLVVASDPNAPVVVELGEDGEQYVVENTQDPAVAERALIAHASQQYDVETYREIAESLKTATYKPVTFWWRDYCNVDGAELVTIDTELPPTLRRGVVITL